MLLRVMLLVLWPLLVDVGCLATCVLVISVGCVACVVGGVAVVVCGGWALWYRDANVDCGCVGTAGCSLWLCCVAWAPSVLHGVCWRCVVWCW